MKLDDFISFLQRVQAHVKNPDAEITFWDNPEDTFEVNPQYTFSYPVSAVVGFHSSVNLEIFRKQN